MNQCSLILISKYFLRNKIRLVSCGYSYVSIYEYNKIPQDILELFNYYYTILKLIADQNMWSEVD